MTDRKRALISLGILLGVPVLLVLAAGIIAVWIPSRRVAHEWAAIRAAGDPVTIADLAPPWVPSDENAAVYLRDAKAEIAAFDEVWPLFQGRDSILQLSPADQAAFRKVFAEHSQLMPLLEQAAACRDYQPDFNYTHPWPDYGYVEFDDYRYLRSVTDVLSCRADLFTAEGRRDEAVRTALLALKLARLWERLPGVVGCVVTHITRSRALRSVSEALQTGAVSDEVRNELDAELALAEPASNYDWIVKSERVVGTMEMRGTLRNQLGAIGHLPQPSFELACLRVYARYLEMGCSLQARTALKQEFAEDRAGLVYFAANIMNNLQDFLLVTHARIRAMRVLNALQRHATPDGKTIPDLNKLGLPKETAIDPFSEQPLKVIARPDGWTVYSIGSDEVDDHGQIEGLSATDIGFGPPYHFTLPDSELYGRKDSMPDEPPAEIDAASAEPGAAPAEIDEATK